MRTFVPLLKSPHLQTILSHFWKRRLDTVRFPVERSFHDTEPGARVLVESQRPEGAARGEIVMVHGLEGSGDASYMRGLSQAGLEAGYAVHRFNLRSCGGTERLSTSCYHSGQTGDVRAVLEDYARRGLGPVFLVGFSLGGNLALKLAGELGDEAAALFRGVCAVSAPIDLEAACRRIAQRDNRLYEIRFVRRMLQRLRATGRYQRRDYAGIRSVMEFDQRITAPAWGFRDALDYYGTQSASGYLERIRVPALVIHARDDVMVPAAMFEHPAFARNPRLRLVMTGHGGHVGFIARARPHFWLEGVVIEWMGELLGTNRAADSFS